MTRYAHNLTKIKLLLLVLAAVLTAWLVSFVPASAQSVAVQTPEPHTRAMVKNMPYPFEDGVAVKSSRWQLITASLVAADTMRVQSQRTITALTKAIQSDSVALAELKKLQSYDQKKVESLKAELGKKQGLLTQAETNLAAANRAIERLVGKLPKRIRKIVASSPVDQQATVLVEYINTLVWRKWYWFGAGVPAGFIALLIIKGLL